MKYKTLFASLFALILIFSLTGCDPSAPTADQVDASRQEDIQRNISASAGMPSIVNGREKKLLKDIYEMRDQSGLNTYTYLQSEYTGKLVFFCNSIGYGIPYSTQYSNPQKLVSNDGNANSYAHIPMPQAEPNGLFPPQSAEGTWIFAVAPDGKAVPIYVEPKVVVLPFPAPDSILQK